MTRSEFLGIEPDAMDRWRADAEKQERAFAEARRKEEEELRQRQEAAAAYEASLLRNAFEARIVALEQENADLWANLFEGARATRYAKKGDLDRAIADYGEAIRLNPKEAAAYHNRGKPGSTRVTSTAPSPTTARPSGSIPRMWAASTLGVGRAPLLGAISSKL
jgi:tetratricopeptide (TPR) repeat protein